MAAGCVEMGAKSFAEPRVFRVRLCSLWDWTANASASGELLEEAFGECGLGLDKGAGVAERARLETAYDAFASFSRLWAVQISRHSSLTFSSPRKRNWRKPRAALIWPKTGSTVCLRNRYRLR